MGAGINDLIAGGVQPININSQAAQVHALQLRDMYAQQQERQAAAAQHLAATQELNRKTAGTATMGRLISENTTQDENGQPVVDKFAVYKGLNAAGFPDLALGQAKEDRANEKEALDAHEKKLKIVGDQTKLISNGAQSLLNLPDDALVDAYEALRTNFRSEIGPQADQMTGPAAFYVSSGGIKALRNHIAQLGSQATASNEQVQAQQANLAYALKLNEFHHNVLEKAPDTFGKWLTRGGQVIGQAQNEEQKQAGLFNLEKAGAPPEVLSTFAGPWSPEAQQNAEEMGMTPEEREKKRHNITGEEQALTAEQRQTQRFTEEQRHNRAMESNAAARLAAEGATPQLTPEAKTKMAEMFAATGTLPAIGGMGKGPTKIKSDIINEAAAKFPSVDFASNKAAFVANSASLKALQTTQDRVVAFENTAGKNIDMFLKTAGKVIDTGSPVLNAPVRMLSDKVFGSENMAAFKVAREVALTEAAKVLESPGGNQALTVSGRDALKTLSDPDNTLKMQVAAMNTLRKDMAARKQSNEEQLGAIRKRIGSATNPQQAEPVAPSATHRYNPATGKIEAIQ